MAFNWNKNQALIKLVVGTVLAVGGWVAHSAWTAGREYQHVNDRIEQHDRSLQQNGLDHKEIKDDVKGEVSSLRKDMNNGFKEVTRELAAVGQKVDDLRDARQVTKPNVDRYGLAIGGANAKGQ